MVTPKSEEQLANEAIVTRTAKELARNHIADALLDACKVLCRDLGQISLDHQGRLGSAAPVGKTGYDLAGELMKSILVTHPIDYRKLIAQANEDDDVVDEDSIHDSVRQYVETVMKDWGGA